jgi:hypothetical protein
MADLIQIAAIWELHEIGYVYSTLIRESAEDKLDENDATSVRAHGLKPIASSSALMRGHPQVNR